MTSSIAASRPQEPAASQDLAAIVEQTWRAYLDDADTAIDLAPGTLRPVEVTAALSITGAWNGHLVIATSNHAATMIVAKLLDNAEHDVNVNDISDGLGELANIVGGNLKLVLPGPCALSLPWVVLGPPTITRFPATEPSQTLNAVWRGEPITIALLVKTNDHRRLRATSAAH